MHMKRPVSENIPVKRRVYNDTISSVTLNLIGCLIFFFKSSTLEGKKQKQTKKMSALLFYIVARSVLSIMYRGNVV